MLWKNVFHLKKRVFPLKGNTRFFKRKHPFDTEKQSVSFKGTFHFLKAGY